MGVPTIGIPTKVDSLFGVLAELSLQISWAFDESVCQTRSVTNFYTAQLLFIANFEEIDQAIAHGEQYMAPYSTLAEQIADEDWNKVVILVDAELEGIATQAALAFAETPQMPATYYHILDVRHWARGLD